MKIIKIKSESETVKFAKQLASKLRGGQIIALQGDLGAGKTTLTKFLAKELGVKKHITSPTFVLMKVYPINKPSLSITKLVHVDCYRLEDPQELFYLGIEEYLNHEGRLVVIEWADKIKNYLNKFKNIIWITIEIKDQQRIFKIK